MKPIIMYVDDEAHNLTVLEAALPSEWEIHTFDSPLAALDKLPTLNPWVVLSDQRMPGMMGVNFLEIVKKVSPNSVRALVTGYSDEDLVIDSVRKAQVYDYIRKPWDVDDLEHRVRKMVDTYILETELREKNEKLEKQNAELKKISDDLMLAKSKEESLRKELEAWAPPFILSSITDPSIKFPMKKDLAVITFDLIGSSKLHDVMVGGKPARSHILHMFSELVLKHGGWRESHSGDSAYAHFGLLKEIERSADAAFAVANEFRVFLRSFNSVNNVEVECGIGLHLAKNTTVDLHIINVTLPDETKMMQKSFDSTSMDIDLVHRIEKLVHSLPGSNIMMTEDFVQALTTLPFAAQNMGSKLLKGQTKPINLWLKASDKVKAEDLKKFIEEVQFQPPVLSSSKPSAA